MAKGWSLKSVGICLCLLLILQYLLFSFYQVNILHDKRPIFLNPLSPQSSYQTGIRSQQLLQRREQVSLPAVSLDQTLLFLGTILEPNYDDGNLYLILFVNILVPSLLIHHEKKFLCQFHFIDNDEMFQVPVELIQDIEKSNFTIFKCRILDLFLLRTGKSVLVEIISAESSIIEFSLDPNVRMSGLGTPIYMSKRFNAWQEAHPFTSPSSSSDLCVYPFKISKTDELTTLTNFLDHHLQLGFNHIYLGIIPSNNLNLLLFTSLKSYIEQEVITILLLTTENQQFDIISSTSPQLFHELQSTYYLNICLYLSKSISKFLGVWNIEDYFHHFYNTKIDTSPILTKLVEIQSTSSSSSSFSSYSQLRKLGSLILPCQSDNNNQPNSNLEDQRVHVFFESKNVIMATFLMWQLSSVVSSSLNSNLLTIPLRFPVINSNDCCFGALNSPQLLKKPHYATLPAFSTDFTEVVVSSMIERVPQSTDLFVTTFFLNHVLFTQMSPHFKETTRNPTNRTWNEVMTGFLQIHPNYLEPWKQIMLSSQNFHYFSSGKRQSSTYICRLRNTETDETVYLSEGEFLPNRQSPDVRSNRRLDVLRCPIMHANQDIYLKYIENNELLVVEILKKDSLGRERDGDGDVIIRFTIPWSSRRIGYTLTTSSDSSNYQAWNGLINQKSSSHLAYLCVAGLFSPFTLKTVALLAEYIQHHLLVGFDHIFLITSYAWDSQDMALIIRVFQQFIQEKKLTITSQLSLPSSISKINYLPELLGLSITRDNANIYSTNMCLYLAKGTADYIGIWDFDEFFIPKPPHHTIADVINSVTINQNNTSSSGRFSFADHNLHPFCYLILNSEVYFRSPPSSLSSPSSPSSSDEENHRWIGIAYQHSSENHPNLQFKKSILPTRNIFQSGLHMPGGCKLPFPYSGCLKSMDSKFCYNEQGQIKNSRYHRFDDLVLDGDAKLIHPANIASIYHFQVHRKTLLASKEALHGSRNVYATHYFPSVLTQLHQNKYQTLIEISNSHSNEELKLYSSSFPVYSPDNKHILLGGFIQSNVISTILLQSQTSQFHNRISCRITNDQRSSSYVTDGQFLHGDGEGNHESSDGDTNNSDRFIDIIQCPLLNSYHTPQEVSKLNDLLTITILENNLAIFHYTIPWSQGFVGFMLNSTGQINLNNLTNLNDKINPNHRLSPLYSSSLTSSSFQNKFLSLVLKEDTLTTLVYANLVEFIQHHLMLGISHIFLSVPYSTADPSYQQLADLLLVHLQNGSLSIQSHFISIIELKQKFNYSFLQSLHLSLWNLLLRQKFPNSTILSMTKFDYLLPLSRSSLSSSKQIHQESLLVTLTGPWIGGGSSFRLLTPSDPSQPHSLQYLPSSSSSSSNNLDDLLHCSFIPQQSLVSQSSSSPLSPSLSSSSSSSSSSLCLKYSQQYFPSLLQAIQQFNFDLPVIIPTSIDDDPIPASPHANNRPPQQPRHRQTSPQTPPEWSSFYQLYESLILH